MRALIGAAGDEVQQQQQQQKLLPYRMRIKIS